MLREISYPMICNCPQIQVSGRKFLSFFLFAQIHAEYEILRLLAKQFTDLKRCKGNKFFISISHV